MKRVTAQKQLRGRFQLKCQAVPNPSAVFAGKVSQHITFTYLWSEPGSALGRGHKDNGSPALA